MTSLVSTTHLVNGVSIHSHGSPRIVRGDVPLVFVHGLGVSVQYFEPTMERLAPKYTVVGLDLPGFGESGSTPRALDTSELAQAVSGWLDARAIGPAILIGNSYGCQVVTKLVVQEPGRAVGLVLSAPTMDRSHRSVAGQLMRAIADIPREPAGLGLLVARAYLRAGPLRLLSTLRHALDDHIEERLPHIRVPTLVVCGARDPVVTEAWAEEVARMTGTQSPGSAGATLSVIPTAAHALPYDDPDALAGLIDTFVTRIHQGGSAR